MARRSVIIIVLFLIGEGILLAVYCARPGLHDCITFGATVLAASFALFQFLDKAQHDRYESAGEFIKRWNDPSLNSVPLEIRAILTDALLLEPLTKKSDRPDQFKKEENEKRGQQVIGALNFFEELAVAVHKRRVDERYLYDMLSVTVEIVWKKFKPWIDADFSRRRGSGTQETNPFFRKPPSCAVGPERALGYALRCGILNFPRTTIAPSPMLTSRAVEGSGTTVGSNKPWIVPETTSVEGSPNIVTPPLASEEVKALASVATTRKSELSPGSSEGSASVPKKNPTMPPWIASILFTESGATSPEPLT
jgi:hypothetical protein